MRTKRIPKECQGDGCHEKPTQTVINVEWGEIEVLYFCMDCTARYEMSVPEMETD